MSHGMRLLFVVPRFGDAIAGGAERLVGLLATHAVAPGDHVEIATTCARSNETWQNELPAGTSTEAGVIVHRFPIRDRQAARFDELHQQLHRSGRLSYLNELELMANSVWAPGLQRFLELRADEFDVVLFAPYLLGTTYWGMQVAPERSVLIPCIHDEPNAHMRCIRQMVEGAAGCIFNSAGEERLARSLYRLPLHAVVGMGFEIPTDPAPRGFARQHGLPRYLVYLGRLEEGKGVATAVSYVADYARASGRDLRLVLVGAGSYRPSKRDAPYVLETGFLDEQAKRSALAGAVALVQPSHLESFSIVTMEAWLEGVPVLVAAQSEVLLDHCQSSGGGQAFADYPQFARALDHMLDNEVERVAMGRAGQAYVCNEFDWPTVADRFRGFLRKVTEGRPRSSVSAGPHQ